jgi:carbon storage regulator
MLVLTRKVGQAIVIGDDIEITLVRIEGDQVRIGVAAPRSLLVCRKELLEEIRQENIRAAEAARLGSQQVLDQIAQAAARPPRPGSPPSAARRRRKKSPSSG